jgi:hyperosmotically inducible periplasmic protein
VSQMKPNRKLVATRATIAYVAAAAALCTFSAFSGAAFAQDDQNAQPAPSTQAAPEPAPHPTRAGARKANHQLEHQVRIALSHAKIDTTDILIRAKGSKVALIGAVPEQNMIPQASDVAGKVQGVTGVQNLLILRPESDD